MKIGVVGAGPAGLASLKYALDDGHECDTFEQTGELGGTWVYTDKTGIDENGVPVHSSMYKGMRTNLPKELMTYTDFPYPETMVKSYIDYEEVLDYFKNYAVAFSLHKHIKFFNRVINISPLKDSKWSVITKNVKTGGEETFEYDSIFVCNGHNSVPNIPAIPGQNLYKGVQIHSHNYRTPEPYRNKRVLVIGAGSSGTDISVKLSELAEHVFLSYRGDPPVKFKKNFTGKPVVTRLYKTGPIFDDGTKEEVDIILYCTGYNYTYPFLSKDCEISVVNNWVKPLYKHIVNIRHPTMFFIGILGLIPVVPVCDIQVRFALAALKKKFLPPTTMMLKDLSDYVEDKIKNNTVQNHYHRIGRYNLEKYLLELSNIAKIPRTPSVINKLYSRVTMNRNLEDRFKIIDNDNFIELH